MMKPTRPTPESPVEHPGSRSVGLASIASKTRKPKWVGTARCAIPAPCRRGTLCSPPWISARFLPPAGRGRRQRSALSLPRSNDAQLRFLGNTHPRRNGPGGGVLLSFGVPPSGGAGRADAELPAQRFSDDCNSCSFVKFVSGSFRFQPQNFLGEGHSAGLFTCVTALCGSCCLAH